MNSVYSKALIMFCTIILGMILKRASILDQKDAVIISKIMLNITCPAMIVCNLNGLLIGKDILLAIIAGLLVNLLFFLGGIMFSKNDCPDDKVMKIFSTSSMNVGGLGLPLISAISPPAGVAAVVAFNYVGTPIFTLGVAPSAGTSIYSGSGNLTFKKIIYYLFRSTCGITCFAMIGLCLLHISFPESIMGFFDFLYKANNTIAMIAIGILLDLNITKDELKKDFYVVVIRYLVAIICALIIYFVIPFSDDIKKALTLVVFVPPSSTNPAIALQTGYKGSGVANIISVDIIISIILMYALMLFLY